MKLVTKVKEHSRIIIHCDLLKRKECLHKIFAATGYQLLSQIANSSMVNDFFFRISQGFVKVKIFRVKGII